MSRISNNREEHMAVGISTYFKISAERNNHSWRYNLLTATTKKMIKELAITLKIPNYKEDVDESKNNH